MARAKRRRTRVDSHPRSRQDAAPIRSRKTADGWENVFSGLGVDGRDRRRSTDVSVLTLAWGDCEALYRGDDTAAKIADEPAREATRRWLDVLIQDDKEAAEIIERQMRKLRAQARFRDAMAKSRAYGGAGVLMGIEDGRDPDKPVNENAITGVRFLTTFDAIEIYPRTWYGDSGQEKYGMPETYWISPQGLATRATMVVHESRVLRFEGVYVSRRQWVRNRGWGDSAFVRVLEALRDFGMAIGGAAHLLSDFSQAVLKIRGLTELMSNGQEETVRKRLEAIELGRSIVRAAVLDAGDGEDGDGGESFERKATPMAGYADIVDRLMLRLASAADMPMSRLFGQANGGLGSDDKAGTTWWTERIEGMQQEVLLEPAEKLVRYLLLAQEGPTKGKEPENWSIAFRPLRQLDPVQEAERRLKVAQADAAYVQAGIVLPEEIATSRFGGDVYSIETTLDMDTRDAYGRIPDVGGDPDEKEPGSGPIPSGKPGQATTPNSGEAGMKPGAATEEKVPQPKGGTGEPGANTEPMPRARKKSTPRPRG